MLFHHNGYVSHDPRIFAAAGYGENRPEELPDEMDVLIVGSGPAGMVAAAQLSMFPNVNTRIIERRAGRLELGRADGIQTRSTETFQAFRFAQEIIEEGYIITEMSFWQQDPDHPENIVRGARPIDDEHGISEFPHMIVNQARVLDYFARFAHRGPGKIRPDYGWTFHSLEVGEGEYPVKVTVEDSHGNERAVRAKYVIGCDGAKSKVRKSIGRKLAGDQANQAWGVMDVVADTDFPDWRTKCVIHSQAGSILHIPREGGYLSRMYIDLGIVPEDDDGKIRQTPVEDVIAKANEIMHPYYLNVKEVAWSSVYEVGHRLVDAFDNTTLSPRVFLTGDACHTHSAKAGQGMNVSIQDGFNIAWKLGQVLDGRAPEELLCTYHSERQPAAKNLIDFDREWSTLMASPSEDVEDAEKIEKFYIAAEEFAAGMLTQYEPNLIVGDGSHQQLAAGYPIGRRFKSAKAVRRCDANVIHIGHTHFADGRYRIYAFADERAGAADAQERANSQLAAWATAVEETVNRLIPTGGDATTYLDIHAIYQQDYWDVEVLDAPELFRPKVGKYAIPHWENVWATGRGTDIFTERELSRDGVVVIVRPDQYVAAVLPLNEPEKTTAYLNQVLRPGKPVPQPAAH